MGKSLITFWGSLHQTTVSGAVVGLTLVTTRSEHLSGNFSASDNEVSNMNCNMKLLLPMDASLSRRSRSSNLSGSVGLQSRDEFPVDGDDAISLDDDATDRDDDGVFCISRSSHNAWASIPS